MMQEVRIKRLQLHSTGGNRMARRLALQQALRQTRMQPSFLPSSALLVIRRLDRLPPIDLTASTSQQWMRHVQRRVDELARCAVRPAVQYVRADAPSVLFLDGVELLTCYTRDSLAGRDAWYWDELFPMSPGAGVDDRLLATWSGHMEALPLTLSRLSPAEAVQALNGLDRRALAILGHRMQAVFDLSIAPHAPADGGMKGAEYQPHTLASVSVSPFVEPPWAEWLPSSVGRRLPVAAESFLGFCYALAGRPQIVHSPHFVRQAARWFADASARPRSMRLPELGAATVDEQTLATSLDIGVKQGPDSPEQVAPERSSGGVHGPPETELSHPTVADPADEPVIASLGEGVSTALGGAFYLLNLLTRLQLPWAVEAVAEVNPWDFLAALTALLLGERSLHHRDDPLWSLLAGLAGRNLDESWGAGLAQPSTFDLRPEWLKAHHLDAVACTAEATAGRTRLWSTDLGFLLADLLGEPESQRLLDEQFSAAGVKLMWTHGDGPVLAPLHPFVEKRISPGFGWWLRRGWPFLHFALRRVLNKSDLQLAALVRSPVTIQASDTHLDVHFALERIGMDVRRAGLDQSPGWARHWGHIVTFYFD